MNVHADELRLLEAAQGGDDAALSEIIARYSPSIFRFGMKMCRNEEDAEEVMQDTLLAAARHLGDFRGQSSLSTWLYTIARSFCIKRRRKHVGEPKRHEPLHELSAEGVPELVDATAPDLRAEANELGAALERAIDELDPMYRDVLVLRDVEGLTAPEVGAVLELSVEAVKSRLHRARAQVRDRIAPLFAPEPEAPPGTSCPDVIEILSRHLEDDVSPEVCSEMELHVAGCPRCNARCSSLRQALALCKASPLPEVSPEICALVKRQMRAALVELEGQTR
ncbi:MAG: sigma-70 family RNA polymerase sigma factor [Myxococcales bacterium]|nr:sigma-70 family RNA polymerase sigma factor [Myxococcales bacterium]